VGRWSILGAGAVVTRPVPENCTAVGVPARVIKQRPEGWHLA
jgi:acetyltransferase-like isoleucine patch superfamily enzyme